MASTEISEAQGLKLQKLQKISRILFIASIGSVLVALLGFFATIGDWIPREIAGGVDALLAGVELLFWPSVIAGFVFWTQARKLAARLGVPRGSAALLTKFALPPAELKIRLMLRRKRFRAAAIFCGFWAGLGLFAVPVLLMMGYLAMKSSSMSNHPDLLGNLVLALGVFWMTTHTPSIIFGFWFKSKAKQARLAAESLDTAPAQVVTIETFASEDAVTPVAKLKRDDK